MQRRLTQKKIGTHLAHFRTILHFGNMCHGNMITTRFNAVNMQRG
jgi:hypothetical protein